MGLIWVLVSFPRIFLGNNRKVGKLCENGQVKITKSHQNYPTYKNKSILCSISFENGLEVFQNRLKNHSKTSGDRKIRNSKFFRIAEKIKFLTKNHDRQLQKLKFILWYLSPFLCKKYRPNFQKKNPFLTHFWPILVRFCSF